MLRVRLCLCWWVCVAVFSLLLPSITEAQLRPKILILFDTSGSMLDNNDRDGSPLCGNNGQSSRVFQLKTALFDALQGLGAKEVDLALATFPQMVDPTQNPTCPLGHYYTTTAQQSEILYNGNRRNGCKISTHDANNQTNANCINGSGDPCSSWYTQFKSEVLKVPFGTVPETLMAYFDQQEDADQLAPLANPEIRAFAWTPLGKSLFYSYGYFYKEIVLAPTDYRKSCERLAIAFFTDGEETCNESSSNAFYPTKWAANLNTNLGVVTHTVAIDLSSSLLQSIATQGKGTYVEVGGDQTALKKAFLDIVAKSQPPSETCNGLDDDCDNLVDEDFPQKGKPCTNGKIGACYRAGIYVCKPDGTGVMCNAADATGTAEICNGVDDDCNGVVDDNVPGGCNMCVPQPEACNGMDDNCNGQIDDNIQSVPCGVTVGECKAGMTKCDAGKPVCDGVLMGSEEICDGKDNDCDGVTDGMAQLCYPYPTGCDVQTGICKGVCKVGTQLCNAALWEACSGAIGPLEEACDGIDNNCDGQVDEQAQCPGGAQCIAGECTKPCGAGEFSCPRGQLCKNGWCVQDTCDAQTCTARGWICKAGACIDPCDGVTCGKLETCEKGLCVDQSCYSNGCPTDQRCIAGNCQVDACAGVSCGAAEFCQQGQCVKLCETLVCAEGQSCQVVDNSGKLATQCVADACAGKKCGAGFMCQNGNCTADPCFSMRCEKGEICAAGQCKADPCERTRCPTGYSCSVGDSGEVGNCVSAAIFGKDLLAAGAGGCACTVGDPFAGLMSGGIGAELVLILGLGVVLRYRRKRRQLPPSSSSSS